MKNELFVPAIDLCLLIIVVLLLSVFAVRYSTKGTGEKAFARIDSVAPNTEAYLKAPQPPFVAIIIKDNSIDACLIVGQRKEQFHSYGSLNDFATGIDKKQTYVIYEEKKSELLSGVIRSLVRANVPIIQIAKVGS